MKQIKTAEEILLELALPFKPTECNFRLPMIIEAMQTYAQQLKPEWTDDDIEFAFYAGVNNIDVHGLPHIKCDKAFEMLIEKMKKEREAKTLLPNPKQ